MRRLLLFAVFLSALVGPMAGAAEASTTLVGNTAIAGFHDTNPAGLAEAFPTTASASGIAGDMSVYVDSGSTATTLIAGLYANANGRPGTLLATGSTLSPAAGQWNQLVLTSSPDLTSGTTYWLTLLGTGGTLAFRDTNPKSGVCSENSYHGNLSTLPAKWVVGLKWPTCDVSAYVTGPLSASPTPPPTSPPPTSSAPANTGLPTISGTTTEGQTLTASNGSWTGSPTSYTYFWQSCDSTGVNCGNISGATSSTYTLQSGDVGSTLRVIVEATNSAGYTPATSATTAVVAAGTSEPPPTPAAPVNSTPPSLSGTATQGQTLTTSNGSWSGSPSGYGYQWKQCNSSGNGCTNISGATTSSYTLTSGNVGNTVLADVTATNAGGSASASSSAMGPVAASTTTPPPTSSTGCAGTPGSGAPDYAALDACGFPSPDTTGVPSGVTLTPVAVANLPSGASWSGGTLDISGNNVTVSGLNVQGTIYISGTNDTVENSEVLEGDGDDDIFIAGSSGATIKNSTIEGTGNVTNDELCGRAIHMAGSVVVTVVSVYITDCSDGVVGLSNTSNSYIMINGTYCGSACSHDEPIYDPGGGSGNPQTTIEHNTLFNTQQQVAAIFADCHAYGPCWNMTFTDNIVEGGDYTIECCDGSGAVSPSGHTVITDNRFSQIFWPLGAQYAAESGVSTTAGSPATVWSGNVWDATGSTVNPGD